MLVNPKNSFPLIKEPDTLPRLWNSFNLPSDEYPKYIYTICSLDNPQDFKPNGDMFVEDMLDWVKS